MKKQNCSEEEKIAEKKYRKKDKRKQRKMKVGGSSVKNLAKIISEK